MMQKLLCFLSTFIFLWPASLALTVANEPSLIIEATIKNSSYTRTQLLALPYLKTITMSNNRAYPNIKMHYLSLRLCDLLKSYSIQATDVLEFIATDKFSVLIPANKVMNCSSNSAIGYLALEPKQKWPRLKNNPLSTAGPFDVIWVHPEKSYISNEYWAWSVYEIKVHKKLDAKRFLPAPNVATRVDHKHITNGYHIYISHCAGCHAINHIGKGVIGPDLNIPKNPTEYYPDDKILKKFIRNPLSVRFIKNDRMNESAEDFLSNKDLDDLVRYFHYMAQHR